MPKKTTSSSAQIVLFPTGEPATAVEIDSYVGGSTTAIPDALLGRRRAQIPGCEVVLSGSFRRDIDGLRRIHEELLDLGCVVLSPARVDPVREVEGFVFMKGEETETPERIELKHLEAIQRAAFLWLHAPEGYVGLSAALEVGFAHAQGIPVFSQAEIPDTTLKSFVQHVNSAADVLNVLSSSGRPVPSPNVAAFQHYYKRVASQRGYERESAQNCLLLMVEEVGELAHAIRKREKLVRHGPSRRSDEARELADVFMYIVHMANILGLDLGSAVREKEELNLAKFIRAR